MQENICFHIIVPVYKAERYLGECIQSVLNQTYGNFELILVDDGSPDRSGEICDSYAAKDSRITVYHKPNGGPLQTRLFGIEKAGKDGFAVFLDSDDGLRPFALRVLADTIEKYACDCVLYGAEMMLDGKVIYQLESVSEKPMVVSDKRELLDIVLNREFNALWRKTVRLDLCSGWDFSPFYHLHMREDRLQSLEIYENVQRACFIPDVLYDYRANPDGLTRSLNYKTFKCDYSIQHAEWKFLQRINVFGEEEYRRYRETCMYDFAKQLVLIAEMKTSRKNKLQLFGKTRESAYWKECLSTQNARELKNRKISMIFAAYQRGAYNSILLFAWAYRVMRGGA